MDEYIQTMHLIFKNREFFGFCEAALAGGADQPLARISTAGEETP